MRVLRIITRLNVGGPSFHVLHLARDLVREGGCSLVVHGSLEPGEDGVVSRFDQLGIDHLHLPDLRRAPDLVRDPRALGRILATIRRFRPDVVHTHLAKAGALGRIAARIAGVPAVFHTMHGHLFRGYFRPVLSAAVIRAERILARIASEVLVPGETLRQEILRYGIAPSHRLVAYPPAVDWAEFARGDETRIPEKVQWGARALGEVTIGIVGRLVPVKGHAILMRALARLRKGGQAPRLLVVGDGPEGPRLRDLARDLNLGDRVEFRGWIQDRARLYRDVDFLVLPSENEGVPVVLMEAARCGIPVIATRVGGVPEVVKDGATGLLVASGDEAALAGAIGTLAASPERRDAMGTAARKRAVTRFDPDRLVAFIAERYRRALSEARQAGRAG